MSGKIIARILTETGQPELLDTLVHRLSPADLQSLLMEVYRQRAGKLTPAEVLRQYQNGVFTQPALVDPRALDDFDRIAFSRLPAEFEALELSPVAPLGACSAIATVDQNKILTTGRNTEVSSDPTNVLALECARRRSAGTTGTINLCSSHRALRTEFPREIKGFSPHFRLWGLCSAGRTAGSFRFEIEALCTHIGFYIDVIQSAKETGWGVGAIKVFLTPLDEKFTPLLQTQVLEALGAKYPATVFGFDTQRSQGRGYYLSAAFEIRVCDSSGNEISLGDGGFTDWTQKLLSNRKERLLISGFGTERFVGVFGPPASRKPFTK